jgi:electron transport complex protein RnfD
MAKAEGKAAVVPFSPHIHSGASTTRIMWDVVIALMPAGIVGVWLFGKGALVTIGISVGTALVTELLANLLLKRVPTVLDGSAVITGLLFAYNLPPAAPWYVTAAGAFFSVAVVKWAFGGLGSNFMNPALGGRIFVMAAWPAVMINHWSLPVDSFAAQHPAVVANVSMKISMVTNRDEIVAPVTNYLTNFATNFLTRAEAAAKTVSVDALTSATPLTTLKFHGWDGVQGLGFDQLLPRFLGNVPGCIGETSAAALLLGAVYLVARRAIKVHISLVFIATAALLSWVFGGLPFHSGLFTGHPLYHVLSGGLLLGAFFMATDPVTSPITFAGGIVFGALMGVLTVVIRLWGGSPEGVSYAIVLANIFVPFIDRLTRGRIYGCKLPRPKAEAAK